MFNQSFFKVALAVAAGLVIANLVSSTVPGLKS